MRNTIDHKSLNHVDSKMDKTNDQNTVFVNKMGCTARISYSKTLWCIVCMWVKVKVAPVDSKWKTLKCGN